MLPHVEIDNSVDIMQTAERLEKCVETSSEDSAMTVTPEVAQRPPPALVPLPIPMDYKLKPDAETSDPEEDIPEEKVSLRCATPEKLSFKSEFSKLHEQNPNESVRSWLQRITAMQQEIQRKQKQTQNTANPQPESPKTQFVPQNVQTPQPRVVKYQDLPYMGEMTLDNSKPRRGRKPKKADICHLIYKNYGTIFPGTPKNLVEEPKRLPKKDTVVKRTNVQNRIISSLLEKRLTQEKIKENKIKDQQEPLNLCMRDLNQLKIRLLRKHGNIYASDTSPINEVKSEPPSDDDDVEFVDEIPSSGSSIKMPESSPDLELPNPFLSPNPDLSANPGYVYWPNAGVFLHPNSLQSQLMYYQKLTGGFPESPEETPTQELRKLVPKHVTKLKEKEEPVQESKVKRNATPSNGPTKRKRSAIFIPPIPSENQNNPATEVSICKFKFTGGAKPSLQEKKMLSVDSGGNFRYYSGTGDKSMRGYEFFPRETLQQAGSSHSSSTGAFLQASGEKIPLVNTPDNLKPENFLFSPETSLQTVPNISEAQERRNRKRKTRKSIQREKLEQTFKEKGFLIQTQQLESAEGATYCKFRQLRKFTRYLFRSWKDYLPGNVRELQENELARSSEEEENRELLSPSVNSDQ